MFTSHFSVWQLGSIDAWVCSLVPPSCELWASRGIIYIYIQSEDVDLKNIQICLYSLIFSGLFRSFTQGLSKARWLHYNINACNFTTAR